jgi:hypothetical protein
MRNSALAVSLCLVAGASLAQTPAGWTSHGDKSGKCLVSTPADWKQTELGAGFYASPDQKAQAFVDASDLPYATFKQVLLPMDQFKGAKVLKNTDSLYYAELKGNNPSKRTLYVITARGKAATCRTEITFDNSTEDTAKKIGDSLRVK